MADNCRQFIQALRLVCPVDYSLDLYFHDLRLRVQTNSLSVRDALERYFSEFLEPPHNSGGPASEAGETCAPVNKFSNQSPARSPNQPTGQPHFKITVHEAPLLGSTLWEDSPLALENSFSVKNPDPGKTKIKEEFLDFRDGRIVRKRLTGMSFAFTGEEHAAVGPCAANVNQVVNFVNSRLIAHYLGRRHYLGHASAVSLENNGIALAGFSGMGKSTLALTLMNKGCNFVSNDRVLLSEAAPLQLLGVPKQPRVNPGTLLHNDALRGMLPEAEQERLLMLDPEDLWALEEKHDAFIDQCYGPRRFVPQAPFSGIVVLNWRRDNYRTIMKRVDPMERLDLVAAFKKEPGVFYIAPDGEAAPDEKAYARRLSAMPMYEISGKVDFERAAELCFETLLTE